MELQFYPPGYTPFVDSVSCSPTKWCAALTIDSLACSFNFATCNNNCIEPVNFAFLQTNGVPAGPPSPQLANVSTFTPNRHTLMINAGDMLAASISDPPKGFTTMVRDLTTDQTGFMTASAANGFMNTNIADCSGTPFTFHAEYSTAKQQNQVPWAALEGGVLMQQEIGHGEVCNSVTNKDPFSASFADGQATPTRTSSTPAWADPKARARPVRARAMRARASARTPRRKDRTGRWPVRPTTPTAARSASSPTVTASRRERGPRSSTASPTTEYLGPNQCFDDRFQNGDLDFDGQSYLGPRGRTAAGTSRPRSSTSGRSPTGGHTYPQIQFETNAGASETLCNTATGAGCTVPPMASNFYPFWSLSPLIQRLGAH